MNLSTECTPDTPPSVDVTRYGTLIVATSPTPFDFSAERYRLIDHQAITSTSGHVIHVLYLREK